MNEGKLSGDKHNNPLKSNTLGKALSRSKQIVSISGSNISRYTTPIQRPYHTLLEEKHREYRKKKHTYRFVVKLFKRAFWSAIFAVAAWLVVWYIPEVKSAMDLITTGNATASGSWEVFFSVFGIVYAILVGMLIVEALSRYNELQSLIAQEVNAISDIHDYLVYLKKGDKTISKIKKSLIEYIDLIRGVEWEFMEQRNIPEELSTPPILIQLMKDICDIKTDEDVCKHAQKLMMDRVSEITNYRTERIEKSKEYVAPPMRILVAGLSVAIIVGLICMVVNPMWLHLWMIVVVAIAVAALYEFITDLNRPFGTKEGDDLWAITPELFNKIQEKVCK